MRKTHGADRPVLPEIHKPLTPIATPARCSQTTPSCAIIDGTGVLPTAPKDQERDAMALDEDQRSVILHHAHRLLQMRDFPKTICPSEIARALSPGELHTLGASEWRDTMGAIREVMWEKRQAGEVEVLQKGEVVEAERLEDIRGPIRLRNVNK